MIYCKLIADDFIQRVRGWVMWFDCWLYPGLLKDMPAIPLTNRAVIGLIRRATECNCGAALNEDLIG